MRPVIDNTNVETRSATYQFVSFSVVGAVSFAVNGAVVVLLASQMGPVIAQAAAFPAAASVSWWFNRCYTFGVNDLSWSAECIRYITANVFGWLVNNGLYFTFIFLSVTARRWPILAVSAGSVGGLAFNFTASRRIVFKSQKRPRSE